MLIRNRLFKRIIALILVFAMLLSYAPDKVLAGDGGDGDPDPSSGQFSLDGFRFTYNEVNSWNNYSNAEVTIYNDTEYDKSLWNMTLTYDGVIENIWNADIVECKTNDDGSYSYVIAPKTYNNTIVSGNSVNFGFIAYGKEKSPDMPMFMGFYNDQLSENEAGSDQNENPEIINGREYPIKDEWKALEYTLFSDAEKQSFNTNSMDVEGSVHTNGNFIFEGNSINIDGSLEFAAGITLKTADMPESQSIAASNDKAGKLLMPDITERIHEIIKKDDEKKDESCFEIYSNYTSFGSDHISLDKNIYVEDGLKCNGTTFDTSGIIMAKKDVEFNINDMN